MVRVGHLSTYSIGGAAIAARRLHDGLLRAGAESRFWHGEDPVNHVDDLTFAPLPQTTPSSNVLIKPFQRHWERLRRRRARRNWRQHLEHRPAGFEVFSSPQLFKSAVPDWSRVDCDVVHLHWVAFLIDYPGFFASLPPRKPLVWTLHDQAPFTGGCHYSSGCERFRGRCGECPQVAMSGPQDASRHGFDVKRRAMRGRSPHVVTPSRWLGQLAQQSSIWPTNTEFSVIPYGLDLEVHRPVDGRAVRREFGIEPHEFTFVFGAEDIENRRKGMPHLGKALWSLPAQENWHALVFGDGELPDLPPWLRVHRLGYVRDDERKVACLSAGDIFVLPSLEDNQPQTGLEALACGTPVVAFAAGGIPEYVREGETGWLAPVGNVSALAGALLGAAANTEHRHRLSQQGRLMMQREFPLALQASRMLDLYASLLAGTTLSASTTRRRAA